MQIIAQALLRILLLALGLVAAGCASQTKTNAPTTTNESLEDTSYKTVIVPDDFFDQELERAKQAIAKEGEAPTSIDDLIQQSLEAIKADDPSILMALTFVEGMDDRALTGQQFAHSITLSGLKKRKQPIQWALSPWPEDMPKTHTKRERTITIEQVYYLEPTDMFWVDDPTSEAPLTYFSIGQKNERFYIAGVSRNIKPRGR